MNVVMRPGYINILPLKGSYYKVINGSKNITQIKIKLLQTTRLDQIYPHN